MRSTSASPSGKESSSVLVTVVVMLLVHSLVIVLMTATPAVPGVTAFVRHEHNQYSHRKNQYNTIANINTNTDQYLHIRGGDSDSDSDSDYDEESETESEEDDEASAGLSAIPATLTKATRKAATKAVKTSVATAMKHTMTKKKKKKKNNNSVITQYLRIPYIVKACFNPFVFYQMTKGYWSSLFSHNYLNDLKDTDSSQDLRSALEQKARQGGSKRLGKKKMKPGQAKTLSDLPALNT